MRVLRAVPALGLLIFIVVLGVLDDRLPDPMATHWTFGSEPDGSLRPVPFALLLGGVWCLVWYAVPREQAVIGLAASGLLAGVFALVVRANLDVADWRDARLDVTSLVIAVAGTVIGAIAGWRVARMSRS